MNLGTARPGLTRISVIAEVKADYVNAHSPVWDTLANPVHVESRLADAVKS